MSEITLNCFRSENTILQACGCELTSTHRQTFSLGSTGMANKLI